MAASYHQPLFNPEVHQRLGEALFLVLYKLATDDVLGSEATRDVAYAATRLIGGDTVTKLIRCGLATDLLDTHNYHLDGAQSGDSCEYFFDGNGPTYLQFIDRVIGLAGSHAPVLGYLAIRFMPQSTALLAMQRFPLTVAVEVATARSRLKYVYERLWAELHVAANQAGAIAHWGQEFQQPAAYIEGRYGARMDTWRQMLGELSIDDPAAFSTAFSKGAGLEPTPASGIFDCNAVDMFFAGLHGSTDGPLQDD